MQKPVICGHYQSDPIAGAEDVLDRQIVKGGLRQRERLGFYANEVGSSAVVLLPKDENVGLVSRLQGALVVGLGEYGTLTSAMLVETVRCGVLRLLVVMHERGFRGNAEKGTDGVALAPLLLGYNSTTHISIEDSLASLIRGVIAANRQFAEAMPTSRLQVTELEFVELYRDTAISAAHALRDLPSRMRAELTRAQVVLEPDDCLGEGEGASPRLLDTGSSSGYWPRMLVTDAGTPCDTSDAEDAGTEDGGNQPGTNRQPAPTRIAQRLRYLFLSQRARAEAVVQQRQPQLIETLVASAIHTSQFDLELSRLFFQLMVPTDFKEAARLAERLLLVVDGATANFPWEMLVAEKEPLVTRTELVRQLASTRFRSRIKQATNQSAFVLGNPSTEGFGKVFAVKNPALEKQLPSLGGAAKEADAVAGILRRQDFDVLALSPWASAREVLGGLFQRPHRILHLAAHGIFSEAGRDGQSRTGVVLSDGIVLSAAEVGQLEVVPELVFLNCCHLGVANASPREGGKIAYSLARELIESGVRCVIAAGWEVDDQAAELFARTFYRVLLAEGKTFGEAVLAARKQVWDEMPDCNTWGAYQAYGDPAYRLGKPQDTGGSGRERRWVSAQELEAEISRLIVRAKRRGKEPATVTSADLLQLISSAPAGFVALPGIQEKMARLYAAVGDFAAAAAAYQKAIGAVDRQGSLTVSAIEQLANLEARHGERIGDPSLIQQAAARLKGLLVLSAARGKDSSPLQSNSERLAIYGSVLKRLATCLVQRGAPRDDIRRTLGESLEAYRAAVGDPESDAFNPYPVTSYLQLALLLDTVPPGADALLAKAAERAVADFALNPDFFNAVIPMDVRLTQAAIAGRLPDEALDLVKGYLDASEGVPADDRQWNSVTNQIEYLSRMGKAVGAGRTVIDALDQIAAGLKSASGGSPAATDTKKPAAGRRRGAPSRATPKSRQTASKKARR